MQSAALGGLDARFNLFLPPSAVNGKVPILYYLSGLTCTEDNGYVAYHRLVILLADHAGSAQKGAFLGPASQEGIAILFPDTSPRGAGVEGEDDDWDFGTGMHHRLELGKHAWLRASAGAGFYLNATNPKYAKHYNMLTHVTIEIPEVVEAAGLPIVRPTRQLTTVAL